jgi:hypothetical protein
MAAPPSSRGLRVYSTVAAILAATGTAFGLHEQNANADAQRRAAEGRLAVDAARRTALNAIAHDRATTRWALRTTAAIRTRHDAIVRRARADAARLARQIRAAQPARTVYVDGGVVYRSHTVYVSGGGGATAASGTTAPSSGGAAPSTAPSAPSSPTTKTS